MTTPSNPHPHGLLALSPLAVFFILYLGISLLVQDFYAVPVTVAFTLASIWSIVITRGVSLAERIDLFSAGVANRNLLTMIWIFILAGAFAHAAKDMGAIEAAVRLTVYVLPNQLLLTGLFLASCLISLSIGTSVGTIVALVPVAAGVAEASGIPTGMMAACVLGGAFFGDNLSFISDTTIAATRTQGCGMRDKFRANIVIVLPAALICLALYVFLGREYSFTGVETDALSDGIKVLPYLLVLVTALAGIHVMGVLVLGILSVCATGLLTGSFTFIECLHSMGKGIGGMSELIIVTLLAGGMLAMIRYNGGIDYIMKKFSAHIRGRRGAEASIATLVSLSDFCTANNTIAIITAGPMAKEISSRYGISPQRCAGILDTFSCLIQCIIPYGAQMLMASEMAKVSPLDMAPYLYYPLVLGICAVIYIIRPPSKLRDSDLSSRERKADS